MSVTSNKNFPEAEYNKLKKCMNGNLNELTNDDGFVIPDSCDKLFWEFFEKMLVLSRGNEVDCIKSYKQNDDETAFWDTLEAAIKQNNIPYEETRELRNLSYESYVDCVEEAFEKYIIYSEDLEKNKLLKEEDVFILVKFINFCVRAVIVKRFSINDFKHNIDIMFGLGNEKITFLWNKIQNNIQELRTNYIISRLDELSSILSEEE